MKESLEDLNWNLEEKIITNDELNEKIEQLEKQIDKLNITLENGRRNNQELKEQIESLYTQIDLYENKIEDLVQFKNEAKIKMEELSKANNILESLLGENNKLFIDIYDRFKNKCLDLFNKNKLCYIEIQTLKKEIKIKEDINNEIKEQINKLNLNNTNIEDLYTKMISIIDQLIIKLKQKENCIIKLNKEIIDYKKDILRKKNIINTYLENESKNDKTIDEINELLFNNNIVINNLNHKYNNDLTKLNHFYEKIILTQKKKISKYLYNIDNCIDEIITSSGEFNLDKILISIILIFSSFTFSHRFTHLKSILILASAENYHILIHNSDNFPLIWITIKKDSFNVGGLFHSGSKINSSIFGLISLISQWMISKIIFGPSFIDYKIFLPT